MHIVVLKTILKWRRMYSDLLERQYFNGTVWKCHRRAFAQNFVAHLKKIFYTAYKTIELRLRNLSATFNVKISIILVYSTIQNRYKSTSRVPRIVI